MASYSHVPLAGVMPGSPLQRVPAFAAEFNKEGLHGHLLAVAMEGGSVWLMDTRKQLSESVVSGKLLMSCPGLVCTKYFFIHQEIGCHKNAICDIAWVAGGQKLVSG